MEMLDVHKEALESLNVAYHVFLLFYNQGGKMLFGFVEGKEDPSFYRNFIENVAYEPWQCKLISAGNKQKVLAVFATMDWTRFPRKAICFFVDRDLSEYLGGVGFSGENLFVRSKMNS